MHVTVQLRINATFYATFAQHKDGFALHCLISMLTCHKILYINIISIPVAEYLAIWRQYGAFLSEISQKVVCSYRQISKEPLAESVT